MKRFISKILILVIVVSGIYLMGGEIGESTVVHAETYVVTDHKGNVLFKNLSISGGHPIVINKVYDRDVNRISVEYDKFDIKMITDSDKLIDSIYIESNEKLPKKLKREIEEAMEGNLRSYHSFNYYNYNYDSRFSNGRYLYSYKRYLFAGSDYDDAHFSVCRTKKYIKNTAKEFIWELSFGERGYMFFGDKMLGYDGDYKDYRKICKKAGKWLDEWGFIWDYVEINNGKNVPDFVGIFIYKDPNFIPNISLNHRR